MSEVTAELIERDRRTALRGLGAYRLVPSWHRGAEMLVSARSRAHHLAAALARVAADRRRLGLPGLALLSVALGAVLGWAPGLGPLGWLVAALAVAALGCRLRAATLQARGLQADKDALIAELERTRTTSDVARARAEESSLAKSRFLATLSHELRTPLNAILGFSEVMQAELFGRHAVPVYKEYARDIHSSGELLLKLINEILDLSRVEAGHYELREDPVDLAAILSECRHLVSLRAAKKSIEIVEVYGRRLPLLWADGRALRQVALNLLSNAIKFTPQGGRVRIEVGLTAEGAHFLSIADTGAGIPQSEIPLVMAAFGRGAYALKTGEEGTGLGLPIVKGLVELHGGTLTLRSEEGAGTEVVIGFPAARAMTEAPHLDLEFEVRDAA